MSATSAAAKHFTPPTPAASLVTPSWLPGFQTLPREHGFEPLRLEGRLPADLHGTLFRNGPAHAESQGQRYEHWFDGDGALTAIRLEGGQVLGACRTIATAALVEERRRGRMEFSSYGTAPRGGLFKLLKRKNAANTNVVMWQGRLLALFEQGKPTEISPADLSMISDDALGDLVLQNFSAHPHHVAARKAAYNFGLRYGRHTMLDLYELPDAGPARRMTSIPLSGATMIHDFIATERHLIFFAPPLRLRIWSLLFGKGSYSDNLAWKPEHGTEVLVVPIDDPDKVMRFQAEPFFQWHFANAFEEAGRVVVDFVRLEDFDSNLYLGKLPQGGSGAPYGGRSARATLDLATQQLRTEIYSDTCVEFPRVSSAVLAKQHRYIYLDAHAQREDSRTSPFRFIVQQDRETGQERLLGFGEGHYPGEPVFVRRPGARSEDDGYVLTLVYDSHASTSYLAVVDALRFEDGPVCRAHFDHVIPMGFHGNFVRDQMASSRAGSSSVPAQRPVLAAARAAQLAAR